MAERYLLFELEKAEQAAPDKSPSAHQPQASKTSSILDHPHLDDPVDKCSNEHVLSVLQIEQLRRQLREKFPAAHRAPVPPSEPKPKPTSTPDEEELTFSPGHLSEVISPHPSAGTSLVLRKLLAQKRDLPLVLIDGRDTFDPASYGNPRCRRLLWLRCTKTNQALQCADLLLCDGNLPLLLLDLHLTPGRELRQVPASLWHRLKIQARESDASLVTLTPRALVPTPHRRLTLNNRFTLDHLELSPPNLAFDQAEEHHLTGKG